jgi:hypothetical protein
VEGRRALVASNEGLALVDLDALPPQGTQAYLSRVTGVHVRNVYQKDPRYFLLNLFGGECTDGTCGPGGSPGFAVVRRTGDTLALLATEEDPTAFYEKMFIDGDLLYVAAHLKGLRIFDLSDPEAPRFSEVGRLGTGFVDAWAVAVHEGLAYVADGAGGLKIVDVSVPTAPRMVAGETIATSAGSSQDVVLRDGRVYVAAGGAGVAAYIAGSLGSRQLHPAGHFAKDLEWIGDRLAVATYDGLVVFDVGPATSLVPVATEVAQRRGAAASLRLCSAVGAGPDGEVLAANWDYMDRYRLVPAASATQPDLDASVQRIRFHRDGGTQAVTLSNDGGGPLTVSDVLSTRPTFTVSWTGGTLLPGESVTFDVVYLGSDTTQGSAEVRILSDDPDESPMVIRVYGNTDFLDPGDAAPDFTRPTLEKDAAGALVDGSWTLSDHRGRVVWFNIFSSW